jgi:hypothetical protein
VVHIYLNGGISDDEISADNITADTSRQEKTVRIAENGVLFNDVVNGTCPALQKADAKVDFLGITICS